MRAAVFVGVCLGAVLATAVIVSAVIGQGAAVLLLMGVGLLGTAMGVVEGHLRRKERS